MEKQTITFKDLSFWLKAGIVAGWVYIVFFLFAFVWGFIEGLGA